MSLEESSLPPITRSSPLEEIIEGMLTLRQRRRKKWASVPKIIEAQLYRQRAKAEENKRTGIAFNPFNAIPISEPIHSRLIGDLLNPKGAHGQGNLFLTSFLRLLDVPDPERGRWRVSIERSNVDICLSRMDPASVIIIENKSNWAIDQPSQLYRYWAGQVHSRHRNLDYQAAGTKENFQIIYLVPHGSKNLDIQSVQRPSGWEELPLYAEFEEVPLNTQKLLLKELFANWEKTCLPRISNENQRLKTFLAFYSELWQDSDHDE